ncbi:Regulatory protein [Hyella patelloides LEGE 07179]|uniref:Regulatory protein n=1 Tax=Hyella patelloides LEGE 07179 TaxID=945734 RepID=A0A563W003_9CYAN|nr:AraC family transcriptional regulator [Hyella patelloides]VEP17006.1 Regulatory protein [Hyella patelloides LEGE 07179]
MKVYTDAEYDRLYRESLSCEQIENNLRGFDLVRAAKSQWYEGQNCYANLLSGIKLEFVDEQIFLDCHKLTEHCDCPILTAKFYLSGYHSVICPGIDGIAPEYAETKGQNYLFYLPDIKEIEQFWAGDCLKLLRMEIDLAYIRNFATELNTIPKHLQALIENENPQRFHFKVGGVTLQMQTIVEQISCHPYHGAIAKMYLEAKVLELLALQLSQLSESNPDATNSTLKNKNIDRIYQARDILVNQLENPPSISELTQQVGISDFTLRRGFQEIFGTTVIGYLTSLRLEQAKLLLREKKLSVAEVANSVGYTHLGYFAKVFKRQFGITPSECLAGRLSSK